MNVSDANEKIAQINYKEAKKTYSYLLICLVLYNVLAILVSLVFELLIGDSNENISMLMNIVLLVVPQYLIAFPITALLIKRKNTKSVEQAEKIKVPVKTLAGTICLCFSATIVSGFVVNFISIVTTILTDKIMIDPVTELLYDIPYAIIFVLTIILAPITEELLFRKWFIDITEKYGKTLSAFSAALCFALFHANINQFFYAFMIGFILSVIYIKTKKIIYPIIIHVIFNFFGSITVPLSMYMLENMPKEFMELSPEQLLSEEYILHFANNPPDNILLLALCGLIITVITVGILAAAIIGIVFLAKNRTIFKFMPTSNDIPKQKAFSVIFLNVGGVIFLIGTVVLTIVTFIMYLQ